MNRKTSKNTKKFLAIAGFLLCVFYLITPLGNRFFEAAHSLTHMISQSGEHHHFSDHEKTESQSKNAHYSHNKKTHDHLKNHRADHHHSSSHAHEEDVIKHEHKYLMVLGELLPDKSASEDPFLIFPVIDKHLVNKPYSKLLAPGVKKELIYSRTPFPRDGVSNNLLKPPMVALLT